MLLLFIPIPPSLNPFMKLLTFNKFVAIKSFPSKQYYPLCASELHFLEAVINSQTRTSLAQPGTKSNPFNSVLARIRPKKTFARLKLMILGKDM